jgi:hypothetical protein
MKNAAIAMMGALALTAVVATGCHSTSHSSATPRPTTPAPQAPPPAITTTPDTPVTTAPPVTSLPATTAPAASPSSGSGTCHVSGFGLYVLPDPNCTPGATDPTVTRANIDRTICTKGWTSTVRPSEDYTETLKRQQMVAYSETGPLSDYEEDHLIPLELGGSPTSPQNLWPEPGASPNPKDAVEDVANAAVCDGRMTLASAQQAIASNWIAFGQQLGVTPTSPPGASSPAAASSPQASESTRTASCTVSASYDSQYSDYDVSVHSNQPDQTVSVTTNGAPTASWHTDSTGYADVYLKASRDAAGHSVTATVGGASCSSTLS